MFWSNLSLLQFQLPSVYCHQVNKVWTHSIGRLISLWCANKGTTGGLIGYTALLPAQYHYNKLSLQALLSQVFSSKSHLLPFYGEPGKNAKRHHHFSTASFKIAHFQASPTFLVLFCHICLNTNWRTRGDLGTRLMPRLAWSNGPLVPISENSLTHPLLPLHTPQSDVNRRTQSRKRIEEMGTTASEVFPVLDIHWHIMYVSHTGKHRHIKFVAPVTLCIVDY